MLRPIKLE